MKSFPSPRLILLASLSYLVEERLVTLRAKQEALVEQLNYIEVVNVR